MDRLRLSFSAAKAYMDCPRKYHARREVDFTDPRIRLVGSLTHAVLERYIILSQESGYTEANFCIAHDTIMTPDFAPDVAAECKRLAWSWARGTIGETLELIPEQMLAVDEDGSPVPADSPLAALCGVVDVLEFRADGSAIVTDFKTGWADVAEMDELQARIYAALAFKTYPGLPRVWTLWEGLRTGTSKIKEWTPAQGQETFDQLMALRRQIMADTTFFPTPGSACAMCSHVHCGVEIPDDHHVQTPEDAEKLAGVLSNLEARAAEIKKRLKLWCSVNGPAGEWGWKQEGGDGYTDAGLFFLECQQQDIDPLPFLKVDNLKAKKLHDRVPGCLMNTRKTAFGKVKNG